MAHRFWPSIDQRITDLGLRLNTIGLTEVCSFSGRTQVDPSTITGNVVNIIFLGQSTNNNDIVGGTYSPTYGSSVYNIGPGNKGTVFIAAKPLLCSDLTDDHHGRWLADSLIDTGLADKVILTMSAMGGSLCVDWAPGGGAYGSGGGAGTRNGELAYRIGLSARNIAAAGLSSVPNIIDWQQGEADTDSATSQADYTAALNKVIAECKKVGLLVSGKDVMFIHKCTRISGDSGARTAIRAAQAAVCDGVLVRAGADIDTLDSSYRYDGTHFNFATGAPAQAALKYTVYDTWL